MLEDVTLSFLCLIILQLHALARLTNRAPGLLEKVVCGRDSCINGPGLYKV